MTVSIRCREGRTAEPQITTLPVSTISFYSLSRGAYSGTWTTETLDTHGYLFLFAVARGVQRNRSHKL